MPRDWTDTYSFTRGAVAAADCGYLVLCADDLARSNTPHGLCVQWTAGKWKQVGLVNKLITSIAVLAPGSREMAAVCEFGTVIVYDGAASHEEEIRSINDSPAALGALRCIRGIRGRFYAAGMKRQVYVRLDKGRWMAIDNGARPPVESKQVVGFESIDGFSDKEIYAAGWLGEIWKYDGKIWRQIDSPTNIILTNVCCAGDDNVYIAGRLGLLIRGRNQEWEVLDTHNFKEDFWGMAWYQGKLYLSTTRSVYSWEGDRLERVDFEDDVPATCYQLSVAGDQMWSIGAKDVMAFDGTEWVRID